MRFDAPESSEGGSIFPSSPSMDRVVNNFRRSGLGRGAGSLSRPPFLLLLLLNFTSFLLAAPPPPTTLREKFVASIHHRRKSRNNWTTSSPPLSTGGLPSDSGHRLRDVLRRGICEVDSVLRRRKCKIRQSGLRHSGTSVSQLTDTGHQSDHANDATMSEGGKGGSMHRCNAREVPLLPWARSTALRRHRINSLG